MNNNFLTFVGSSAIATGLIFGSALSAKAFTLNFDSSSQSTNTPATGASATADFDFFDNTSGGVDLKITLTNTTPDGVNQTTFGAGATESTLVGLGFDIIETGNVITAIEYDPNGTAFIQLFADNVDSNINVTAVNGGQKQTGNNSQSGANLGNLSFDLGIRSSGMGNFGGGNPQTGLTRGQSGMALFNLDTSLNAVALETAFLAGFQSGDLNFAARFQEVNAGAGSDKLIGGDVTPDPEDPNNNPPSPIDVPEPGTFLGLGLFTLAAGKFARKRK